MNKLTVLSLLSLAFFNSQYIEASVGVNSDSAESYKRGKKLEININRKDIQQDINIRQPLHNFFLTNQNSRGGIRFETKSFSSTNYQDFILSFRRFNEEFKGSARLVSPNLWLKSRDQFCASKNIYKNSDFEFKKLKTKSKRLGTNNSTESQLVHCLMSLVKEGVKINIVPSSVNLSPPPKGATGNWNNLTLSDLIRLSNFSKLNGYRSIHFRGSSQSLLNLDLLDKKKVSNKEGSKYLKETFSLTSSKLRSSSSRYIVSMKSQEVKLSIAGKLFDSNFPLSDKLSSSISEFDINNINVDIDTKATFARNQMIALGVVDELRTRAELLIGSGALIDLKHRFNSKATSNSKATDFSSKMLNAYNFASTNSLRFFEFNFLTNIGLMNKGVEVRKSRSWDYRDNEPESIVNSREFNRVGLWVVGKSSKDSSIENYFSIKKDTHFRTTNEDVLKRQSSFAFFVNPSRRDKGQFEDRRELATDLLNVDWKIMKDIYSTESN